MKKEPNIVDAEIVAESTHTDAAKESVDQEEAAQQSDWQAKLLSADHWLRFVFMILFMVIAGVASYVVTVLIFIQFIFALVTGNSEVKLQKFGRKLSQYIFQILNFLTYNTEEKPFPFSDWPSVDE
ncbi:MAG: Flp pilus assembly protein TadB [Kiritimatiellia bacterium]|jgi:Flp pilus assembly protein TadB